MCAEIELSRILAAYKENAESCAAGCPVLLKTSDLFRKDGYCDHPTKGFYVQDTSKLPDRCPIWGRGSVRR